MVEISHDSWLEKSSLNQITLRGTLAGLAIGSVVLFSNFQFGLQTGWVSMMSLPSSLLAFATFKAFQPYLSIPFSDVENVYVQSLAVAVGTGPLTFGLVGIIPAIEKFLKPSEAGVDEPISLNIWQLISWCCGLAFFGVFFAVLLRTQLIVREKLKFPSGSATATMIAVLHQAPVRDLDQPTPSTDGITFEQNDLTTEEQDLTISPEETVDLEHLSKGIYSKNMQFLSYSFAVSALYTLSAYFVPTLRNLPVFGTHLAKDYLWTFQPSPAYVGQGIIMGLPTVSSMLLGALLGWAILGPMAIHFGWAPGPIDDWKTGAQGWILWISLSIMVVDTVTSFLAVSLISLYNSRSKLPFLSALFARSGYSALSSDAVIKTTEPDEDAPPQQVVSNSWALIGLGVSTILCIVTVRWAFGPIVPIYSILIAVIMALFLSVLGVRALGETDLNPVSGIGKISQLLFALIIPRDHPSAVLINLIAGGITEAGASQAGDLMQDLKTGHLIGASPKAQFYAQIIGSGWSVILSAFVYRLYDAVYEIPGPLFRIPTAVIWIDCSRLVTGQGLPTNVGPFAYGFAILFGILSIIKVIYSHQRHSKWTRFIPSGVAVGIGIYNSPSFTLARFLGGVAAAIWLHKWSDHNSKVLLIVLSSGLVLGEGVFSIVSMIFTSMHVPHF